MASLQGEGGGGWGGRARKDPFLLETNLTLGGVGG